MKNCCQKSKKKSACFEWTFEHSGNDYKDAMLSKLYLTVKGIITQRISIGQF